MSEVTLAPTAVANTELIVSNHSLSQIAKCSTMAHISFVLNLQNPEKAFRAEVGSAFHKGAEELLRTGDIERACAIFTQHHPETPLVARGEPVEARPAYRLENTGLIFREWALAHTPDKLKYTIVPEFIEGWLMRELTEGIHYRARLDYAIIADHTGILAPCDLKTKDKLNEYAFASFRMTSQVDGTLWLYREHYQDPRIVTMLVNIVGLEMLPTPGKKCRIHGCDYSECRQHHAKFEPAFIHRTLPQLEEWRKTAVFLANRLRTLRDTYPYQDALPYVRMQGRFTDSCSGGDFDEVCVAHRPL